MSAPRTNIDKQTRHHLVPIIGIIVAVLIAILGFLWWFDDETSNPEIPGEVPGPVDEVPAPAPAPATGTETAPATAPDTTTPAPEAGGAPAE
ncbi:hypothetical protein [Paracoccus sp. TOH]|uniref:Dynamin n=1 Tax=Paracoccus simplex TaxID=2086346 RepID=A0ABV7RXQ9_9RHOB|nr:hypothetical protein [Paracoccus sp. TOH]WJS84309.1 hypothetical protein NBE95_00515 [Paracoccus sp. TOH]